MHIVIEEMLNGRYLAKGLQLLKVGALLLGLVCTRAGGWLRLQVGQAVQGVELILGVERDLALIVPELPV